MSIKSELYKLIEVVVLGGTFTDMLDVEHTFLPIDGVKYFEPYNSDLTNYQEKENFPVPAVLFEFTEGVVEDVQQRISETYDRAVYSSIMDFSLHVITGRYSAGSTKNDYLSMLDIATEISKKIFGRTFPGIQNITLKSEVQDNDNRVLADWILSFSCVLTECGESSLVDANDTTINPNAPVKNDVFVDIHDTPF